MVDVPEIHGICDARFSAVRAAFAENFRQHGEVGAAVAVTLDGTPVVDLWAGWMDRGRTRAWQRDTLVNVFSVGKAMAALSLLILIERGQVDVDAPVARYWPEFAAHGKGDGTVRMLLGHRAGLPAIRHPLPDLAMYDWDHMTAALADEAPWWAPGRGTAITSTPSASSSASWCGASAARASMRSSGDEIAAPLDADFHFGIGPEHDQRVADYYFSETRRNDRR